MRVVQFFPLAAVATRAFVIPDEATANELRIQAKDGLGSSRELIRSSDIRSAFDGIVSTIVEKSHDAVDDVIALAIEAGSSAMSSFGRAKSMAGLAAQSRALDTDGADFLAERDCDGHGRHGHHGHGCHKSNLTVYQLISKSKYTTKLAKLIDEDEDLVKVLNSTNANYTVFAPTDSAFDKLCKHHKPSKEHIKKTLLYHVSPDFYPASRVLVTHTIPTLYKEKNLGDFPQRIRLGLGIKGLELNFHSGVIAINIFGTNGVIHGIDEVLFLPQEVLEVIEYLPGEFSTLELGLRKTNLWHDFNVTATSGQTFFAPTNWAFRKLGPRINAFLFSKAGEKYLKAVLAYHVVSNQTLYSDAFYDATNALMVEGVPKGYFHIDLPTILEGHSLSIDVARYGGFISIRINGFTTVSTQDGVAKDGVIHGLSDVLIPPKKVGGEMWQGETLTVEDLKERLAPFVEEEEEEKEEMDEEL